MKIPKQVKIGGLRFDVKLVDDPIILDEYGDKELGGMIDYNKTEIILHGAVSEEYLSLIFLHEIIHGVFEFMEIDTATDETEAVVSKLANGLHAVLKDNKLDFGG